MAPLLTAALLLFWFLHTHPSLDCIVVIAVVTIDQPLGAQELGFAEADPTSDVEGFDAMYKIAILSKLAFGIMPEPDQISRTGITGVSVADIEKAKANGSTVKFIAQAHREGDSVNVSVSPVEISTKHPLANVDGAMNAVYIDCDNAGEIMLQGAGAGSRPTASAVVSDIFAIAEKL